MELDPYGVTSYSADNVVASKPGGPGLIPGIGNLVLLHSEQKCLNADWFTCDKKMGWKYSQEYNRYTVLCGSLINLSDSQTLTSVIYTRQLGDTTEKSPMQ